MYICNGNVVLFYLMYTKFIQIYKSNIVLIDAKIEFG